MKAIGDAVDFYTIAEGFGIEDESVVDAALRALEIDGDDGSFELRYRDASARPIQLQIVTEPELVREICKEAEERCDPEYETGRREVLAHLERVTEIAQFELGFSQLEDMGVVIAGQLVEWFARTGEGLVRDQNDDWWRMDDDGIPRVLVGPAKR
jgi:hypothetical protein